ncbi:MAG: hypothetical protein JXA87_02180 [Thermoleophilia bacterium]|nr:hypothetical protein [Thermoleophilia bacterium]
MTETDLVRIQNAASHFWEFTSIGELRQVLTEYTAMLDGTLIRRYGQERFHTGGRPATPEEIAEYERCLMRKRSTIDIAMEQMESVYRTWHRVIDLYYRQGLSTESRGWLVLMARLGLRNRRKCPALVRCTVPQIAELEQGRMELRKCDAMIRLCCRWDYDTFQVQVALATERLWHTIEGRREWTP